VGFCTVPQIWHTVVNGAQTVEHDVETDFSDGMHFLQQQEQEIIEEGVKLGIKIIVAIVAAVIAFGFMLYGALRGAMLNGRTEAQNASKIASKARNKWNQQDPKDRNRSDYGGGYLEIFGSNGNNYYFSIPYTANGDPHIELQVIEWAESMIHGYKGSITRINLLIYTFKRPCSVCQDNLLNNVWRQQLQRAAGGSADVQINVWTSYGNQGGYKNVVPWPPKQ